MRQSAAKSKAQTREQCGWRSRRRGDKCTKLVTSPARIEAQENNLAPIIKAHHRGKTLAPIILSAAAKPKFNARRREAVPRGADTRNYVKYQSEIRRNVIMPAPTHRLPRHTSKRSIRHCGGARDKSASGKIKRGDMARHHGLRRDNACRH